MQKLALLLAALGLGAIAGWLARRRTPAEVRRLEYHMTFPEELIAVFSDPVQLGMTLGVAAGVAGIVAAQAGRRHAAQHPLPQQGLALPGADPDTQAQIVQMAEQAAEAALVGPKI
jgi:hypothetical protein